MEKRSADQSEMRLSAFSEMNAGESPIDRPFQAGNVNLGEVKIRCICAMHAGNELSIDDGKTQLHSESSVNTAFRRTGIYQSRMPSARQIGFSPAAGLGCGVKADLYMQSWAIPDERILTCEAGPVLESYLNLRHCEACTTQKPAVSSGAPRLV